MQLSEAIDKQLKEFDDLFDLTNYVLNASFNGTNKVEAIKVNCNEDVKSWLRTAIKQAILDIVPGDGDWGQFGCASWGVYKKELLNRIEN